MWYFSSPEWANKIALQTSHQTLTYQALAEAVTARQNWLKAQQVTRVAIAMDNSIEWVLFDLACQQANICCVPVPGFFSDTQTTHLVTQSGIELLLTESNNNSEQKDTRASPFAGIDAVRFPVTQTPQIPEGTHKITFTSGTTGNPKGVCLSAESQRNVARSLVDAVDIKHVRHLSLLPLATLLENIAGVYAPLMVGGTILLASQTERGFSGSRLTDPKRLLMLINEQQPNSLILVPELLSLFVGACAQGWQPPQSLQFIAVGGGKVAAGLLQKARALGLPVYQGYGLSECASVVALNTKKSEQISAAGKTLPHNQVHIEDDELVIKGNLFLGYLNQPESFYPSAVYTGDLVTLENGFLTIEGRRKNVLINSFGRNISPEWVEAELMASGHFREVLVAGDAQPHCVALLTPLQKNASQQQIAAVVDQVNIRLPDYAQIGCWITLEQPLVSVPGLVTATGKPVRERIFNHFKASLENLYSLENKENFRVLLEQQRQERNKPMSLYQRLQNETQAERQYLVTSAIIQRCFHGKITLDNYLDFLSQAYHHVKHTVPLLMATGSRLPDEKEWLREAIGEYIEEEMGHQEWILNDIAAAGGDKDAVRHSEPGAAAELMVAYAYDAIQRKNPLRFFGMVFVLEGTSIALADNAAQQIQEKLKLPKEAFSYLSSHGALDQEHIVFFENLMNKITAKEEQDQIIHSAKMFFKLYANIFREIDNETASEQAA
jgi:long-subunit acyl-CoA synthetase (AMP-forming)/thiaminase